jgi:rhodanese-related sulfurtransferase
MRRGLVSAIALTAVLMFSGCASSGTPEAAKGVATPKVAELIAKNKLEVVDYAYTRAKVADGTRTGAKALLIDARPAKKYAGSTIPSSLNIPDTEFDKYVGQLDKVAKDKEIIVYCGGWACEKSPIVAGLLKAKGFTNVKLYQAGEPEWKKLNYIEVGTPVVDSAVAKNAAVIIDARPYKKFLGETIPGAISIPDTDLPALAGRYPADKTTPIITFCGGYACHKSHVVAKDLVAKGYTNVKVYAAGMPEWKKAGNATTGGGAKKPAAAAPKAAAGMVNGVKLGADEGTVDGEWFKANYKTLANVQIVDVRSPSEHKVGAMAGAINIEAGKLSAKDFVAKLPKDKVVVFHCASGGRAMEALEKAKEGGADMSKTYYFDANLNCTGSECKIEVNEPLG